MTGYLSGFFDGLMFLIFVWGGGLLCIALLAGIVQLIEWFTKD